MLDIPRLRNHARQFVVPGLLLAMLGLSLAISMTCISAPISDGSAPSATAGKVSNSSPADVTRHSASDRAVISSSPAPASPLTSVDQPAQEGRVSEAYGKLPPRSQANRARTDSGRLVRLPGEVPPALASATRLSNRMAADAPLTLTIVMKRTDQAGFDRYYQKVYDPRSPSFRHFLSQGEISARFGPTRKAYGAVLDYLRRQGFTLLQGSANRLTLTVRGTRAQVERAFSVEIGEFEDGGRRFFSNDRDPAVPRSLASNVLAVIGLSNLAVPKSAVTLLGVLAEAFAQANLELLIANRYLAFVSEEAAAGNKGALIELAFAIGRVNRALRVYEIMRARYYARLALQSFFGAVAPTDQNPPATEANQKTDSVQKIGLPAFSSFRQSDVADSLALFSLPASLVNQVSRVDVNGGAPLTADQTDVLLGINTILSLAPKAQVTVYDAPLAGPGTSFQTLFNAMINDGVTVISNDFGYCEDQTTAADVQSIDAILKTAAASGISVFNATGDFGGSCRDGSANTIAVPADSPNATAVGGTSVSPGPGFTYGGEKWWDGSADVPPSGQSGFGVSRFFARPSYQEGLISGPSRSAPDVVAAALPGAPLCEADAGGCNTRMLYGGTSLATPLWAAMTANINDSQGRPLGFLNPRLYQLAGTSAFHSASSMGSDAAHVGLGAPNGDLLDLALRGLTPGPVDPKVSTVTASFSDPLVPFVGYVFAEAARIIYIVVKLNDADGNIVTGKTVTLSASAGSHAVITPASGVSTVDNGAVVFTVKDTTVEDVTFTATADGVKLSQTVTVSFIGPPATAGGISANPITVSANGGDKTTITVTLQDAKGNPSPGKLVSLSQGNGSSRVSGTTATTDATGKVQFTATDLVAETVTYTAVDITDGNLPVPGSAVVNFTNAPYPPPCNIGSGKAAPGYAVTTFASGFPTGEGLFDRCEGPFGLAFDARGNLFVGDFDADNRPLYRFPPQGGAAGPATLVGSTGVNNLAGIAYTKDGRLYAADQAKGTVVELDPNSGAILRNVAAVPSATGMAVDPLSGDLFVSALPLNCGDGLYRISNFANGTGTVTKYFYTCGPRADGLAFAPDGTIYYAGSFNLTGTIFSLTGTNGPSPPVFNVIANVPTADGIALEPNPANPSKPFLYVNRNDGVITRIDQSVSPPTLTDIYTNGSRGDFVTVGPDGCLYATQTDRVIKVTKADGTCGLSPVNPAPQIVLTPVTVSPSPAQGTPVTFTATLRNVSTPAGTPITLTVIGPNLQTMLVRADANGQAKFTYTGIFTGDDTLVATAPVGTQALVSNTAQVTWTAGKHTTFLSLNQSPGSGSANKPLTLVGTLVDVSASPVATVAGVPVSFTLAGQTCSATTDGGGTASCSLTPNVAVGSYQTTATFGGTNLLLPSSDRKNLDLIEAALTVQFSAANYNTPTGCAAVQITVTRTGDSSSPATVDYSTSDGTATQRSDYTISSGTVTFAAGETSKTFPILITEDNYVKGNEQFTLTLSNPTGGASLGTPFVATVTVIDGNTTPPTTNPNDDSGVFVCHHYHDFLAREADAGGAAYWTGEINKCGTDQACLIGRRVGVSAAYFTSREFQESGYYVYRLYKAGLGRQPSYTEFMPDRSRVVGGADLEASRSAFANLFVSRPAFTQQYPTTMTAEQYVDTLNGNTGGSVVQSDRDALVNGLKNGLETRATILRKVADNQSFQQKEYNPAFVLMQYFGYLRRDPDADGYQFWLRIMNGLDKSAFQGMTCAFITSFEYQDRFGPVRTHSNADCGNAH